MARWYLLDLLSSCALVNLLMSYINLTWLWLQVEIMGESHVHWKFSRYFTLAKIDRRFVDLKTYSIHQLSLEWPADPTWILDCL